MGSKAEREDRNADLIAYYKSGKNLRETGLAFGLSHERVRQLLKRAGVRKAERCAIRGCNCARKDGKVFCVEHYRQLPKKPKICAEPSCQRPVKTRGMCNYHYEKALRLGTIQPLRAWGGKRLTIAEKLLRRREVVDSGCWLWTGLRLNSGYGLLNVDRRPRGVHRLAYEEWVGPIVDGNCVHHKCSVRHCFNPDHLELTSQQANLAEMHERRAYKRKITELEAALEQKDAA